MRKNYRRGLRVQGDQKASGGIRMQGRLNIPPEINYHRYRHKSRCNSITPFVVDKDVKIMERQPTAWYTAVHGFWSVEISNDRLGASQ